MNIKKAALLLSLALCGVFAFGGCKEKTPSGNETTKDDSSGTEPAPTVTEAEDPLAEHKKKAAALDGKRVIFIGNSYMYYGQMVRSGDFVRQSVAMRSHDDGIFHELLKELGAEVEVVNWTFGTHQLSDFFSESCDAGKSCQGENHFAALKDQAFDYVVLQICGREHSYDYLPYLDQALAFFRSTNPDTKFIYLYNPAAYGINGFKNGTVMDEALQNKELIASKGVTLVDWGAIVTGFINGKLRVEGSKQAYNQESFIIAQNEKDGYHPNQLAGYITTVMTYMAMTGDTAEGLPYDFVGNGKINPKNDLQTFKSKYYILKSTNYDKILENEKEMKGILKLIDEVGLN